MIEHVAFSILKFNKIYTFAYDIRPKLYVCLEKADYKIDRIFEVSNNRIIIHSKYNTCAK